MSEIYEPSTSSKILTTNYSLNKVTPIKKIKNTVAKGKENNASSKSPKGKSNYDILHHFSCNCIYIIYMLFSVTDLQARSSISAYANKLTGTGNLLMNNGLSSSTEAGCGTSVHKVGASSIPKAPVDKTNTSKQDSFGQLTHRVENDDQQLQFEESNETITGSTNTHDSLKQDSNSAQKHVKVSLYQMLLGNTFFINNACFY